MPSVRQSYVLVTSSSELKAHFKLHSPVHTYTLSAFDEHQSLYVEALRL